MSGERNGEPLWGYEEAAEYLGVAVSTVKRWAAQRKIPVVKLGQLNRFLPSALRAWVAENSQPAEER